MLNQQDDGVLKGVLVPVAREGYPFIAAFAVLTLLLYAVWEPLGFVGLVPHVFPLHLPVFPSC